MVRVIKLGAQGSGGVIIPRSVQKTFGYRTRGHVTRVLGSRLIVGFGDLTDLFQTLTII